MNTARRCPPKPSPPCSQLCFTTGALEYWTLSSLWWVTYIVRDGSSIVLETNIFWILYQTIFPVLHLQHPRRNWWGRKRLRLLLRSCWLIWEGDVQGRRLRLFHAASPSRQSGTNASSKLKRYRFERVGTGVKLPSTPFYKHKYNRGVWNTRFYTVLLDHHGPTDRQTDRHF